MVHTASLALMCLHVVTVRISFHVFAIAYYPRRLCEKRKAKIYCYYTTYLIEISCSYYSFILHIPYIIVVFVKLQGNYILCSSEDAQCCILLMCGCATKQCFDCHIMRESAWGGKVCKDGGGGGGGGLAYCFFSHVNIYWG